MDQLVGDKTKELWGKSIKKVFDGLGRCITIYKQDLESDCPNCYYDKVNRESTGKYKPGGPSPFTRGRCPVCKGRGYTRIPRKKDIHALVTWNPNLERTNELLFTEAGKESNSIVRLKTEPCYIELIRESKYAIIDGVRCELAMPPIIRGLGTRKVLEAFFVSAEKMNPGEAA